jgi:carbamoyl-phosphate synthase large subunit
MSINSKDKIHVLPAAKEFKKLNFKIIATKGTQKFLKDNGIDSELIFKLHEDRPNIVDRIKNKEIQLVINTPSGTSSEYDDSYIRKNAIKYGIPYITTIAAAMAAAKGIEKRKHGNAALKSLQEYHKGIK